MQIATDFSLNCGLIINIFWIIFTNLSRNNVYMSCIFPSQKYEGFCPDRVCFLMPRPRRGSVRPAYGMLSTMTSQRVSCNGERVHWFYLHVCARHTCNFILQQSVRIFTPLPKHCFSADELTTGEFPEMENTQQPVHTAYCNFKYFKFAVQNSQITIQQIILLCKIFKQNHSLYQAYLWKWVLLENCMCLVDWAKDKSVSWDG